MFFDLDLHDDLKAHIDGESSQYVLIILMLIYYIYNKYIAAYCKYAISSLLCSILFPISAICYLKFCISNSILSEETLSNVTRRLRASKKLA